MPESFARSAKTRNWTCAACSGSTGPPIQEQLALRRRARRQDHRAAAGMAALGQDPQPTRPSIGSGHSTARSASRSTRSTSSACGCSETPIVLRLLEGRLEIDPIESKLNGGILHADPELVQMKDGSTWLEFSSETRLRRRRHQRRSLAPRALVRRSGAGRRHPRAGAGLIRAGRRRVSLGRLPRRI